MAASTMLIGGRSVSTGAVGGVAGRSGQTYFFFAPLFIPFFILGVPIVDMAFAFVRRTANRTGFSTPDKNHLHHRLLRLGHGHRRSVLILWAWTVLLSGFILFPLYVSSVNAVIPFGALALGVVLYTLFHPSLRKHSGLGPEGELPVDVHDAEGSTEPDPAAPTADGVPVSSGRTTPAAGVPAATAAPSGEL
jgi:UDP-GlcNAc:undecaprenyl-phosphate GlcNAc-1-phosphate transferase